MKIVVIGAGYVGLTSAAVLADIGNTVFLLEQNQSRVEGLRQGRMPFFEPFLEDVVRRNITAGRLIPSTSYAETIPHADIVFICVGTPSKEQGEADVSFVFSAAKELAPYLSGYTVVVDKSTVPVGTAQKVKEIIAAHAPRGAEFDVASTPEFLRQGSALADTMNPDRVVIGTDSKKAEALLVELHKPLPGERLLTNIPTAEMIKYAANAFLATSISFVNSISAVCEKVGANVTQVADAMKMDKRIGKHAFLNAGCGYGGSCFPKDVKALIHISKANGVAADLLDAVESVNQRTKERIVQKIEMLLGSVENKKVTIWGLAFKPDTDDLREAPSLIVVQNLVQKGAIVHAYDPVAEEKMRMHFPQVVYHDGALASVRDADCLVILTEWDEFRHVDRERLRLDMKSPNIVDGRNIYLVEEMKKHGFNYISFGRE